MVQIKEVPDEVHHTLKARAAESGLSLSEFLRIELGKIATRPSTAELRRRIEARGPLGSRETAADLVRAMRDEE